MRPGNPNIANTPSADLLGEALEFVGDMFVDGKWKGTPNQNELLAFMLRSGHLSRDAVRDFVKNRTFSEAPHARLHPDDWEAGFLQGSAKPARNRLSAEGQEYTEAALRKTLLRPIQIHPTADREAFMAGVKAGQEYRKSWDNHRGKKTWNGLSESLADYFNEERIQSLPVETRPRVRIRIEGRQLEIYRRSEPHDRSGVAKASSSAQLFNQHKDLFHTLLYQLLTDLKHLPDSNRRRTAVDLRILVTAFPTHEFPEEELKNLLTEQHLQIQIILTNPTNKKLVRARHGARKDGETPENAIASIVHQHRRLSMLPRTTPGGGSFELKLSNLMPLGFYALTRTRALLGLYWSDVSFHAGPLIEVTDESALWTALNQDFEARWYYSDHE